MIKPDGEGRENEVRKQQPGTLSHTELSPEAYTKS